MEGPLWLLGEAEGEPSPAQGRGCRSGRGGRAQPGRVAGNLHEFPATGIKHDFSLGLSPEGWGFPWAGELRAGSLRRGSGRGARPRGTRPCQAAGSV